MHSLARGAPGTTFCTSSTPFTLSFERTECIFIRVSKAGSLIGWTRTSAAAFRCRVSTEVSMQAVVINNGSVLTDKQRLTLLDVIDELDAVTTEKGFRAYLDGALQRLLPHGCAVCGTAGDVHETWKPNRLLFNHFPAEYLETLNQLQGGLRSDMAARWRATRAPVLMDPESSGPHWWTESCLTTLNKYQLRNGMAHGF